METTAAQELRRTWLERGATAVEYALIAALIAGVIFVVVAGVGNPTRSMFQKHANGLADQGVLS